MDVVFFFYEGMTALDVVGPHEILCRLPGSSVKRVARQAGPVFTDSSDLRLIAEYGLSEVLHADILLIPGGGNATSQREHPEVLEWIKALHQNSIWTTSVCTGSLILGAAGLLKGLRATSHWAALDRLALWGADPVAERVVEDGKVMTAAGVSAGIDMALILTEKLAGFRAAESLQLGIEYDPQPPFAGSPSKANPEIVAALRSRFAAIFEK